MSEKIYIETGEEICFYKKANFSDTLQQMSPEQLGESIQNGMENAEGFSPEQIAEQNQKILFVEAKINEILNESASELSEPLTIDEIKNIINNI